MDLVGEMASALRISEMNTTADYNLAALQQSPMESTEQNSMNFYVELAVDEKRLAEEIGKILQLRIAPVIALDPEAQIIYWPEPIEGGEFPSGIIVTWGRAVHPRMDYIDLAVQLSKNLGARVTVQEHLRTGRRYPGNIAGNRMSRHKTLSPFRCQVFTYIRRVPAASSRSLIRPATSRKHVVMSGCLAEAGGGLTCESTRSGGLIRFSEVQ